MAAFGIHKQAQWTDLPEDAECKGVSFLQTKAANRCSQILQEGLRIGMRSF
jgi:hypothetical protein